MAVYVHEVTKSDHDLLNLLGQLACGSEDEGLALFDSHVEFLENGDRKGGGLASAGLSLGNDIMAFHDWEDSPLLDRRRALEAIKMLTKPRT
ncbi:hypothetical protein BC937DRAFT_93226 [Endogone sp. FLAS-F59071]|nr:hypothetical protein BC937DRAFT_93226 [Endogone sp. FLAS-F59071]|eukprot:RUS14857.1 hypothetical protein BC937DRAFT_93226 [Endogone sp. FLAS-F59071]